MVEFFIKYYDALLEGQVTYGEVLASYLPSYASTTQSLSTAAAMALRSCYAMSEYFPLVVWYWHILDALAMG